MSDSIKTINIDTVAEGIVNRIARGTSQSGNLHCKGGLWVEGTLSGDIIIEGVLVLDVGAEISGRIHVRGPRACLVGKIGLQANGQKSELIVDGLAQLGETLEAQANITAHGIDPFPGAQLDGNMKTVRPVRAEAV